MRDILEGILRFIGLCVMVLILTIIVNKYIVQLVVVSGESMEPNLNNGNILLINKVTKLQDIERYDIVISKTQDKFHRYIIKRVYGLPGETIQIKNNSIYINGEEIKDPYKRDKTFKPGIANEPIKLKENEYFILGDNRNNSCDSRYKNVGPIKRSDIFGEGIIGVFPFVSNLKDFK